jgi:hypothetical protein
MSDDREGVLELAVFGQEVERFMSSSIGIYIAQKIADEVERTMEELRTVNPSDAGAVAAAQAKARVMIDLSGWLREAIAAGQQAQVVLLEAEHAESYSP